MTASFPWIRAVEHRLARWRARFGATWLVGVSGGSDSVALLRLLHELAPRLELDLTVAHLDHGARGEAARADAAFVANLAAALGRPFVLGRWQPTRTAHFEADARRARHDWLGETAVAVGASVVALGHTRDDQAETVLHRVVRGTGLRGLAGIPDCRPLRAGISLVRPLLVCSRQQLRDYLAAREQSFRDDASNADLARTRARIRHDLLPRLAADYNPRVVDALVRLAQHAASADDVLQHEAAIVASEAVESASTTRVVLLRARLLTVPAVVRGEVLRRVWRAAGWPEGQMSASRWQRLNRLVRRAEPARFDVGEAVVAETGPQTLTLSRGVSMPVFSHLPALLEVPGSVEWNEQRIAATEDLGKHYDEVLDRDRLALPLMVRGPRPGDRFDPLGMDGHEQALGDFLRSRRVARSERASTPLVCDQRGIVWVVGHRIAHRVRIMDTTTRRIALSWQPTRDDPNDEG